MGEERAGQQAPLGRALSQARSARGMSVADVASAINLRETVVRAIERDDFALCGGHVYARGHVRAFARLVGLDAGPLLAAYADRYQRPGAASSQPPAEGDAAGRAVTAADSGAVPPLQATARSWLGRNVALERPGPNWALVTGLVLTVVVLLLVVALVGDLRAPGRGTTQVAAPSRTPAASSPTSSPSPTSTLTAPTSPTATGSTSPGNAAQSGVAVALRVTGQSWVSVRDASGRTVFSGLLTNGDARRFRDGTALRLTLGNAGAVQLTVNGTPIGSAGGDGEVVRLRFGPSDPA